MRTVQILLSTLFVLLAVNTMTASGNVKITVDANSLDAFVLELNYESSKDVAVKIEDAFGNELSKQQFPNIKSLKKRFRMVDFVDGQYKVFISENISTTVKIFEVKNGKLDLSAPVKKYFKPSFERTEELLGINFLSFANSTMTMSLRNSDGDRIYIENPNAGGSYNRMLNISELPVGSYIASIRNEDVYYEHRFDVGR